MNEVVAIEVSEREQAWLCWYHGEDDDESADVGASLLRKLWAALPATAGES